MSGPQPAERGRKVRDASRRDLVLAAVRFGDLDRIGRLNVSVKIVEGEKLDLDRRGRNGSWRRDVGRAGTEPKGRNRGGEATNHLAGMVCDWAKIAFR